MYFIKLFLFLVKIIVFFFFFPAPVCSLLPLKIKKTAHLLSENGNDAHLHAEWGK